MAPKAHPFPTLEQLLTLAPHHETLSSLARAIGWRANSFTSRLAREGWTDQVAGVLKPQRTKQDALAAALKEVSDLVP